MIAQTEQTTLGAIHLGLRSDACAYVIVHKFGGTSVADAERIRRVAALMRSKPGGRPIVVCSALAGVTDELRGLAARVRAGKDPGPGCRRLRERHLKVVESLLPAGRKRRELKQRILHLLCALKNTLGRIDEMPGMGAAPVHWFDAVTATGEDLAVELMASALREDGLDAHLLDARVVVRTDDRFGQAVPSDEETYQQVRERVVPLVEEGRVPVLQGFVGATADGTTTTLGRGGSDFTAAIVGAGLDAQEVWIWTDVDGIHSADPAQVPDARVLPELGYEEAVELAYFGAEVIHPAAAKHAVARGLMLRVRNSFRPQVLGTVIRNDIRVRPGVAAVASKHNVVLIQVRCRPLFLAYGFLARVFDVLARHQLPVDLVATSHTSTAFTVDEDEELEQAVRELETFAEVEARANRATLSVVGQGLMSHPALASWVFGVLEGIPIHLVSQASDTGLHLVMAEDDSADAVRTIHRDLVVPSWSDS